MNLIRREWDNLMNFQDGEKYLIEKLYLIKDDTFVSDLFLYKDKNCKYKVFLDTSEKQIALYSTLLPRVYTLTKMNLTILGSILRNIENQEILMEEHINE